jgi:hypothetical protein
MAAVAPALTGQMLQSSTAVRRENPPLTIRELTTVLRCIRDLADRSGLTPYECLALLEEAAGPLRDADRHQLIAALDPSERLNEPIH